MVTLGEGLRVMAVMIRPKITIVTQNFRQFC